MDGPGGYHNKWSKLEKEKYHKRSLICGIKKIWHKQTFLWNGNSLTENLWLAKGKWGGGNLGLADMASSI